MANAISRVASGSGWANDVNRIASGLLGQEPAEITLLKADKSGPFVTLAEAGIVFGAHLLFSADNTKDIGASGATRPRDLYLGRNAVIGGTLSAGATTMGGNLIFSPDNTYDIGASGATRPRSIYAATGVSLPTGADVYISAGVARIGRFSGSDANAEFRHSALAATASAFALVQDSSGNTALNAASGTTLALRVANVNYVTLVPTLLSVTPDLSLAAKLIAGTIGPVSGQQHTVPAVTSDTLVLRATTDTLTNKTLTNPTINAGALSGTFSGSPTLSGTLTLSNAAPLIFSASAARITGPFGDATRGNRPFFQSSAANGDTNVSAMPSGANTIGKFEAYNNATPGSATGIASLEANGTEVRLTSAFASGAGLPLQIYAGGVKAIEVSITGDLTFPAAVYTNFTPTMTQGATPTFTITRARYRLFGKQCHVSIVLAVTGTPGTPGNAIIVGVPSGIQSAATDVVVGECLLSDVSTATNYSAVVYASTATQFYLYGTNGAPLGVTGFAAALNTGDTIRMNLIYEIA